MAFSLTHPSTLPTSFRVYPVVALREGVVFPFTEAHLTFGRAKSNLAIETAIKGDKQVVFVAQKQPVVNPQPEDLYQIGTLCVVEQIAPYGNELLAVVRGVSRVKIGPLSSTEPFFVAPIQVYPEQIVQSDQLEALAKGVVTEFKNAFNLGKSVKFPVFMRLMSGVTGPELANQVANSLELNTADKQALLEVDSLETKFEKILAHLIHEIKILELEHSIHSKTQAKMASSFEKNMREQILRERKKTIQEELQKMGAEGTEDDDDIALLKKRIKAAKMPVT